MHRVRARKTCREQGQCRGCAYALDARRGSDTPNSFFRAPLCARPAAVRSVGSVCAIYEHRPCAMCVSTRATGEWPCAFPPTLQVGQLWSSKAHGAA
eukprot:scaffold90735_cov72-Phaeocystis_antarctica.AAC.1